MPYSIVKKNNKYFVTDNSGVFLQNKKGFKTKKQARAQEIAVILKESKKQHKPVSFYFK